MKNRVFDSMAQASAALGVSKDSLQNMKAQGCPAFRGSRVHERELLSWAHNASQKGPRLIGPDAEVKRRVQNIAVDLCSLQCWVDLEENAQQYGHIAEFIKTKINPVIDELANQVGAWKEDAE